MNETWFFMVWSALGIDYVVQKPLSCCIFDFVRGIQISIPRKQTVTNRPGPRTNVQESFGCFRFGEQSIKLLSRSRSRRWPFIGLGKRLKTPALSKSCSFCLLKESFSSWISSKSHTSNRFFSHKTCWAEDIFGDFVVAVCIEIHLGDHVLFIVLPAWPSAGAKWQKLAPLVRHEPTHFHSKPRVKMTPYVWRKHLVHRPCSTPCLIDLYA